MFKYPQAKEDGTPPKRSIIISLFFLSVTSSVDSCHLFRKVFPKGSRLRKGFFGSTVRALPGMIPSTSPYMRAEKQSVVGSGPTLLPGKSCSMRYLKPSKPNPPLPTHQCDTFSRIHARICSFKNARSVEALTLT